MSCCGQRRLEQREASARGTRSASAAGERSRSAVVFEYTGATGLTVFGSATGVRYRFNRPGARIPVDARDAQRLSTIPMLRRVSPAGGFE